MDSFNFDSATADECLQRAFFHSPQGWQCRRVFKTADAMSDRLVIAVRNAVERNCAGLDPNRKWRAEDLCGERLWNPDGSPGLHRAIGLRVSFLACNGLVPLESVNPRTTGTKCYAIKPGA